MDSICAEDTTIHRLVTIRKKAIFTGQTKIPSLIRNSLNVENKVTNFAFLKFIYTESYIWCFQKLITTTPVLHIRFKITILYRFYHHKFVIMFKFNNFYFQYGFCLRESSFDCVVVNEEELVSLDVFPNDAIFCYIRRGQMRIMIVDGSKMTLNLCQSSFAVGGGNLKFAANKYLDDDLVIFDGFIANSSLVLLPFDVSAACIVLSLVFIIWPHYQYHLSSE
jgi:hypothetical protein